MSTKPEGSAAAFYAAASTLLAHIRLFRETHPDSVNEREVSALYDLLQKVPEGIRALSESTISDLINYVAYRVRDISDLPINDEDAARFSTPIATAVSLAKLRDAVDTLEWQCEKQRKRLARPAWPVAYIVPRHKKAIRAALNWAWRFGE